MIDGLQNNRGMALLMTLLIISLILVITLRFNTSMRSSITNASNLQDAVSLDFMARSAFNSARAVLSLDAEENSFDTLHDDWANLGLAAPFFAYFFQDGQGGLEISDHSGRFQVNSLLIKSEIGDEWGVNEQQKQILVRLLSAEEYELLEDEAQNIVEAIIDWIDENDETYGFGGAEDTYYQSLDVPYSPRNGPMEFIEELLLVRGMTDALYFGTDTAPGLKYLLTPYGRDGKVNINTAHPFLLYALDQDIDWDMVEGMLEFREEEDNDLSSVQWYRNSPGFPTDVMIAPELVTTSSTFFEIVAEVYMGPMRKKVRGMVMRGPGTVTSLISWKLE